MIGGCETGHATLCARLGSQCTRPSDEPGGDEINVIGCTVEEATRRVDKFLDEAALAGDPRCASSTDMGQEHFDADLRNFCRRIHSLRASARKRRIAAARQLPLPRIGAKS